MPTSKTPVKRKPARRRTFHLTYPDTLRTSERSALNRCRQRWDWSYNSILRPKREVPALRFGTLVHKALEAYYGPRNQARKKPLSPARYFDRFYNEELEATEKDWPRWKDEEDNWHEYHELGLGMLEGYVQHWKDSLVHNDSEYITLCVEQRFHTKIWVPPNEPALKPPSPVNYVGTVDRVLYHLPSRRLLFGDYKTTANDPTKNKHLGLDEQAGAYWAMGPNWLQYEAPESVRQQIVKATQHLPRAHRRAIEEFHFDGILYDFLKKNLPDERPVDEEGYAVNKPKKDALLAAAKKEGLPWQGLKVDELIDVIDGAWGKGMAHKHLGEQSKVQPGPLFHREIVYRDAGDRKNVLRRVYEDAKEIGQMRSGKLAIKKSPDKFICIGCQFIDVCELHETDAPGWRDFMDSMYESYSPYAPYEIDADELM